MVIQFPPYDVPIHVFTDRVKYDKFAHRNGITKSEDDNWGETSDNDRLIAVLLPTELDEINTQATIIHECIHVVFKVFSIVGVKVGMEYQEHEHFAWSVDYLYRQIQTKLYGSKKNSRRDTSGRILQEVPVSGEHDDSQKAI